MCTKTAHIKDFGINGCQVPVGNGICGETHSLDIIKQFRKLYEDKINSIDCAAGGDCLQEKLRIQQEWIGDLTEQNEMLVRAVQELENEATERVQMLEEKLQQSAKCVCEAEEMLKQQECKTRELQAKIEYYCSFGDVESMSRELKCKSDECESLKQSLIDTRQALTEEVAIKHDDILQLKRDVFNLEDRCIQADKQTAFRDDIIKELRKEIKQLKQQIPEKYQSICPCPSDSLSPRHLRNSEHSITAAEKPYLIINHNSKRQIGRNTVILIHKDGTVEKSTNFEIERNSTNKTSVYEEHARTCIKCKVKLEERNKDFDILHACKSENDLVNCKNNLKPVKQRSKFTNGGIGISRCKTFLDRTEDILKDMDIEERLKRRKNAALPSVPVKMFISNFEANTK